MEWGLFYRLRCGIALQRLVHTALSLGRLVASYHMGLVRDVFRVPDFGCRAFESHEQNSRGAVQPALPSVWFEAGWCGDKSDRGH
jgi:hypothetical protein